MTPNIDTKLITNVANKAIAKAVTKEYLKLLKAHLEHRLLQAVENVPLDLATDVAIQAAKEVLNRIFWDAQVGNDDSPPTPIVSVPATTSPPPDAPSVGPLPAPIVIEPQAYPSVPLTPISPTPAAVLPDLPSESAVKVSRTKRTPGGWQYSFSPISAEPSPLPTPMPTSVPVGAQGIIPVPIWPAPLADPNEPNGEIPGRGL